MSSNLSKFISSKLKFPFVKISHCNSNPPLPHPHPLYTTLVIFQGVSSQKSLKNHQFQLVAKFVIQCQYTISSVHRASVATMRVCI